MRGRSTGATTTSPGRRGSIGSGSSWRILGAPEPLRRSRRFERGDHRRGGDSTRSAVAPAGSWHHPDGPRSNSLSELLLGGDAWVSRLERATAAALLTLPQRRVARLQMPQVEVVARPAARIAETYGPTGTRSGDPLRLQPLQLARIRLHTERDGIDGQRQQPARDQSHRDPEILFAAGDVDCDERDHPGPHRP